MNLPHAGTNTCPAVSGATQAASDPNLYYVGTKDKFSMAGALGACQAMTPLATLAKVSDATKYQDVNDVTGMTNWME